MYKIILLAFVFFSHPVHETMLSLEYSKENKEFTGYLKANYAELRFDYSFFSGDESEPDLINGGKVPNDKLETYLNNRISVIAGKNKLKGTVKAASLSDDDILVTISFPLDHTARSYTIGNSILADIHRDQSNLLIFKAGETEEGVKLTSSQREHTFVVSK